MKYRKLLLFLLTLFYITSLFSMENVSISLRTGKLYDGSIKGNFLLLASGRGVDIYDISNPNNPVIDYYLDTPGICNDIFVNGNLLYTADGSSGIEVYDITVPQSPNFLSSFLSQNNFKEVYVRDSIFSASTQPYGISIFKFTGSGNISSLSRINLYYEVKGLFMNDSFLVAGLSNNKGFTIYNISDPTNPFQVSPPFSNFPVNDIAGKDTLLFTASGNDGVKIFNIKNPASPESIGLYSTSDYLLYLSLYDSLLFITGLSDSIFVLDINNPSSPSLKTKIKTISPATHPATNGPILYAPENATGEIFSMSGYSKLANLDSLYPVTDGFFSSSYAYVGCQDKGLVILNIQDPYHPSIISIFDSLKTIESIYVRDTVAYLSCEEDGLFILNVSNPYSPFIISSFNTPGILQSVIKIGDILFLADGSDGIETVSIEDINFPQLLDSLHLPGCTYDISILDTIAFISLGNKGFGVINIKEPLNISLIDTITGIGFSKALTTDGKYLFVATMASGVKIYDVTNPQQPSYVTTYPISVPVNDIHYENNLLFLACGLSGIKVIDVTNPINPINKDSLDTPGIASRIGPSRFGLIPVTDYYSFRIDSSYMDTIPPSPVSNLTFEAQDSLIILRWINPGDMDYMATRVLFRNDRFPVNQNDGTIIFDSLRESNSPDSLYHTGLLGDSTHFYYAVYAFDYDTNFSAPALISGISASDTIPPGEVTQVSFNSWSDTIEVYFLTPSDSDFMGVRAMFDLTHFPQNIYDGEIFFDTSFDSNSYTSKKLGGVIYDTTYYFTFFSKDSIPNFSDGVSDSFHTYTDTIPPDTIKEFTATQIIPDTIELQWLNPLDPDLERVELRYSNNYFPHYPPSVDSGNLLCDIQATQDTVLKIWSNANFKPGVRYYFSGFSIDKTGNISQGAHTSCITPKLTKVSISHPHEPTNGGLATWLDSIEVSFTAPVQIPTLQSGVEIKGRKNYTFRVERGSGDRYIFIPPSFSALDTATVTLKETIIDTLGNPFDGNGNGIPDSSDSYSWYFYTGLICDYTQDDTINAEDFIIFKNAFETQDITKETGPCEGTIPYYTLIPDSIIDFEDFSIFIMMWNWSLNNRGIPLITGNTTDSLLQFRKTNNSIIVKTRKYKGLIAGEIILKGISDSFTVRRGKGISENDVFLACYNDEKLLISFGIMSKKMKDNEIAKFLSHPSSEEIRYSYRMFFADNKKEGRGVFSCAESIPKKIILKSIYPNPGKKIKIIYGIPMDMGVMIDVLDVTGRNVATLFKGIKKAGYHSITWKGKKDAIRMPAGVYFIRLKTKNVTVTRTLILMR